jgi:hypothetical protein
MRELIRTNDPVLLSFVESLLREAGIDPLVLDRNMSVMEGSIGILPRRVLVADEDWSRARHVLQTSGVELDG